MIRITASLCAAAMLALTWPSERAVAADMAPVARPPVRTPVVVPRPSWYGSFIGIQGGYAWGGDAIGFSPSAGYAAPFAAGAVPGPLAGDPSGYIAGITYGTNWQFDNVVVGTESDLSFTGIKKTETLGPLAGFTVSGTGEQKIKYMSTSRLRAGFLLGQNTLLFGTGGLATGRVEGSARFNFVAPGACGGAGNCPAGEHEKTLWGWAAGGGLEFSNGPWSMKVEYLHYDLGDLKYRLTDPTLPGESISARTKFAGDLVRGAISYRFNWTFWDVIFGRR